MSAPSPPQNRSFYRKQQHDNGQGAFNPLISIPRRKHSTSKHENRPVFHFRQDDDHDDDSQDEKLSIRLSPPSVPIPFPSSYSPPLASPSSLSASRSSSHPVLLSNGKPLKSSLKSSPSAPLIANSPRATHLRARSAPSTPDSSSSHKNVHFAEKDGLATVRLFRRSGKPVSVSHLSGTDTETETETDSGLRSSFPFPRFPQVPLFEINHTNEGATSLIPAPNPSPYANIHLESISIPSSPQDHSPLLVGSLIVRNIAYEKHVAVRFTLDDWQTTSEVLAKHVMTLPSALDPPTLGDAFAAIATKGDSMWDRFSFTIRLEDYALKLHERVLWLVARFSAGPAGEWWDNNNGKNYRIAFKPVIPPSISRRAVTVSAPAHFSHRGSESHPPVHREPFVPPGCSPAHPEVTAPTRRLTKLSLLNYAAPTASPPTISPTTTHSSNSPLATPPSQHPPLYTLLPSQSNGRYGSPGSPKPNPTIIGGQPISYVQPTSPKLPSHENRSENGTGKDWNPPRSFAGFAQNFGLSLHWPWDNGIERGPDEAEVVSDFRPDDDERNEKKEDDQQFRIKDERSSKFTLGSRGSGHGSGTSSSTNSSDEAPTPPSLSPPAEFHTGGLSPVFRSREGSPTSDSASSRLENTPMKNGEGEKESRSADVGEVYKTLVRQWCFAEGPPPPYSGGSDGVAVG